MDTQRIIAVASDVMRVVGARIRETIRAPRQVRTSEKQGHELVTEIDVWSEETIIQTVAKAFPDHVVIGEETSAELSLRLGKSLEEMLKDSVGWVIDPLDGTTNFTNGIPHVAVSVAVLDRGERRIGLIYDPVRDELFSAVRGQGAFLNGSPIHVSEKRFLRESVIVTGFPYDRQARWKRYEAAYQGIFQASRDLRRSGSATLDQCWVACSRFDGFFEYSLRPWDVAAGSLIVEEAGGRTGNLDPNLQSQGFSIFAESFLFAGPNIFEEMLVIGTEAERTRK